MRHFIFILVGILGFNNLLAAEKDDFGIWTFLGVSKKLSKIVTVYSEAEYRNRNNSGTIDCWSLYGEVSFRICPFLKGGGGYTYIDYNHPSLSWESRHRLNVFLIGNYSVGAWSFAIRERYEEVHRVLSDKKLLSSAYPKRSLRSRIECSYKIPNSIFVPYATAELYTTLHTADGAMLNEKMRYTLGTQIYIAKRHSFSIYYRYIDMMQQSSTNSHILGAGFKFNL